MSMAIPSMVIAFFNRPKYVESCCRNGNMAAPSLHRRVRKEAQLNHALRKPLFLKETAALKFIGFKTAVHKETTRNSSRNNGFFLSPYIGGDFVNLGSIWPEIII